MLAQLNDWIAQLTNGALHRSLKFNGIFNVSHIGTITYMVNDPKKSNAFKDVTGGQSEKFRAQVFRAKRLDPRPLSRNAVLSLHVSGELFA